MGEINMPIDLVLVRHGESEGNLAQSKSMSGDEAAWATEFKGRHTSQYRLTDIGREQARVAGAWVKENIGSFDKYYCSEYVRAMETAALLDLDGPWVSDFFLRERDQGVFASISKKERTQKLSHEVEKRNQDVFYFAPPGGESIANACLRVSRVIGELRAHCAGFKVIVVCHGNIMWGFRLCIEHMNQEKFRELNSNPEHKLENGTIFHYSRRHPETGEISATLDWLRIVYPLNESLSSSKEWMRINRPQWSNAELLKRVEAIPQLVNNTSEELEALKKGHRKKGEPEDFP